MIFKLFQNISSFISFSSAITSFTKSYCSLYLDFFFRFVGSVASSGVGSHVGILSKFFIGNSLLLKLLKNFSLALNDKRRSFKKNCFSIAFYLYLNYLI